MPKSPSRPAAPRGAILLLAGLLIAGGSQIAPGTPKAGIAGFPITQGVNNRFDIDGNGTIDFGFQTTSGSAPSGKVAMGLDNGGVAVFAPDITLTKPTTFQLGDSVNDGLTQAARPAWLVGNGSTLDGGVHYIGVRFKRGTDDHFAWLEVDLTAGGGNGVIVQSQWQDFPLAPITVGPGTFPTVDSFVLEDGTGGSVVWRVTFSGAVTGVDVTDFMVTTSGSAAFSTAAVIASSSTEYLVVLDGVTGNGTLEIDLVDDNSIVDGGSAPLGGPAAGDGNASGPDLDRNGVIVVTTLDDNETADGLVSLREAIAAAETDTSVDGSATGSGADIIEFDPALVAAGDATLKLTLFDDGIDPDEFGATAFKITTDVTIAGPSGDNGLTLRRNVSDAFRLFHVTATGRLRIEDLTLERGAAQGGRGGSGAGGGGGAAGMGGAVFNQGTLEIYRSTLAENRALGGYGHIGNDNNGGGGGGGVGQDGFRESNRGGGPNGGVNAAGGFGGGAGGDGNQGGFGGGGAGGDYIFQSAGASNFTKGGPGGNGGFGGGGGGGGIGRNGVMINSEEGDPSVGGFGGGFGHRGGIEFDAAGDGGGGAGMGGAIFNHLGTVTVDSSTISGSSVRGGDSGALPDGGSTIADGGGGSGFGGGIFNYNGTLTVRHSTINAGVTTGGEGGIDNNGDGVSDGSGAAPADAGGIYSLGDGGTATLVLTNSIVANSSGAINDVVINTINGGTSNSSGTGNLVEFHSGFAGTVAVTADPALGGLADNGGPTFTHAPKVASPAIDAGDGSAVTESFDQRGVRFTRLADGDLDGMDELDIGSFELEFIDYGDAPDLASGSGLLSTLLRIDEELRVSVMGPDALTTTYSYPGALQPRADLNLTYGDPGNAKLTDGIPGLGSAIDSGGWVGFLESNAVLGDTGVPQPRLEFDLGGPTAIDGVEITYYASGTAGIFGPESVVLSYSTDGGLTYPISTTYSSFTRVSTDPTTPGVTDRISFQRSNATHVRLDFFQGNTPGTTIAAWLFLGEVTILPDKDQYGPSAAKVAYNATDDEFLAVWTSDDDTAPLVNGENEIHGIRFDAATRQPIGSQFRISFMGDDAATTGRNAFTGVHPAVVWNSVDNEYLVVWYGIDDTPPLVSGEFEIFGRRIDGDGTLLGSQMRISDLGPNGDPNYQAVNPDVTYNATANEYLVVFRGEDDTAPLVDGEHEIWARRVGASGPLGTDVRVSIQGNEAETDPGVRQDSFPDDAQVEWDSVSNRYLVVWKGDTDSMPPLVDGEEEVFGQYLDAALGTLGSNFLISSMGPDGSTLYWGRDPHLAFNPVDNNFLVVWEGDDDTAPLVNDEFEIYGRFVTGPATFSGSQFRISDIGVDGDSFRGAFDPDVSYNTDANRFTVTFQGDDGLDNKTNIYARRVSNTGALLGGDTLIATGGDEEDLTIDQFSPAIAYGATSDEFFIVWQGEDDVPPLANSEAEILGQFVFDGPARHYNTLAANNGPSHTARGGLRIGALLDPEADGQQSLKADGDDNLDLDDEDGIVSGLGLSAGAPMTLVVAVENSTGDDATLHGWLDLDRNGVFDSGTEKVDVAVPSGTSGNVTLVFPAAPGILTGETFVRLRLSTDPAAANPTGHASDGEVEDHLVPIFPDGFGVPSIDVTTPSGRVTTPTVRLEGTANVHVVGNLTWSNAATGGTGTVASSANWTIPGIPLGPGVNVITVGGVNQFASPALDSVTLTLNPYDFWIANSGQTGADAAFGADPNRDEIPNGHAFYYGATDASLDANDLTPDSEIVLESDVEFFQFTYRRSSDAAYLDAQVSVRPDLTSGTWIDAMSIAGATETVEVGGFGTGVDKVIVKVPTGGSPRFFGRLDLTNRDFPNP